MNLRIYKRAAEVNAYAKVVQEQSDSERDVLGFLPRSAYSEAAAQGKLYIASTDIAGVEHYAGHLLFGGRFPHLRVFQIYALPKFRGHHIGKKLIEELISDAERQYYITVSARVAADLPANEFWERMGFQTIQTKQGGATTGRQINLRRRELDSPTLFSVPDLIPVTTPSMRVSGELPVFALDVNVFLDIVKDRPRGEAAGRLLRAAFSGMLRLFVSPEFVNELMRAAKEGTPDPVVQLALTLPQFTSVPDLFMSNLKNDLAALIFPTRVSSGQLRERDHADLTHLATMIYHGASGFVTSDDAILGKRAELNAKYGIELLGPAELAEIYWPTTWVSAQRAAEAIDGSAIHVLELLEDQRNEVESFLRTCSMGDAQIARAMFPGQSAYPRHRVIVSVAGETIGFAAWDAARGPQSSADGWLVTDSIHPMGELAADILLEVMSRDVCLNRPARLAIGSGHSASMPDYAIRYGFKAGRSAGNDHILEKFCIGRVVTQQNWGELVQIMSNSFGIAMPSTLPTYAGLDTRITISLGGTQISLPLGEFEARFGPVIVMLPKRPIVVVPIQRSYADDLLSTAHQHSLFPRPEASVLRERLYISSPRALSVLTAGAVILFYESKGTDSGRGAVIAAAQVTRTATQEKSSLERGTTRRGVLNFEDIQTVTVDDKAGLTFFNQLFRFENPVSLPRLRQLGCVDGANFVTARQIGETGALAIIEEGKLSARLS